MKKKTSLTPARVIRAGKLPTSSPPRVPSPTLVLKTPTPPRPTPTVTPVIKAPTSTPKPIVTNPPPSPTNVARKVEAGGSFIAQINAYRASNGLGPVSTNDQVCSFAAVRASEIVSDFSHNGFSNRINNKTLPYPSYHEVTENIAMNSDASQIVTMWINSPGHAENMRKDTPYVCVAQSGNYYAYEGWRP